MSNRRALGFGCNTWGDASRRKWLAQPYDLTFASNGLTTQHTTMLNTTTALLFVVALVIDVLTLVGVCVLIGSNFAK